MHLMAAVVENLIKPTVLRGMLAWGRRESGVAYNFTSEEVKPTRTRPTAHCGPWTPCTTCARSTPGR